MHLFLGIDAEGLPDLDPSHLAVLDWNRPLGDPQNVVTIFIPTVLDPEVAPEGKHIIHVYTAGSEPFDLWEGKDRNSREYKEYKRERAKILWDTIERIIPDIKSRVEVEIYASPLTHQRFLRRHRGTYGPALKAGGRLFGTLPLPEVPQPGVLSPIPKLVRCGDSVFPGVGVPAVAARGRHRGVDARAASETSRLDVGRGAGAGEVLEGASGLDGRVSRREERAVPPRRNPSRGRRGAHVPGGVLRPRGGEAEGDGVRR